VREVRNIRLLLEFEGTAFHGWQRQPDVRTVQGVLEDAVFGVFGQRCDVAGAGRTDQGVHAIGYVCNFKVETGLAPDRIAAALQAHLDDDVVVRNARDVPLEFHARFDALSRRYLYRIATEPTALHRRTTHVTHFRLDAGRMQRAAAALVGEHDFTSFTPAQGQAEPICNLMELSVDGSATEVTVTAEANRFLHNMVRIIVGTLIDVGRGRTDPEQMEGILCKRDRTAAGPTAPACGLAFVTARYPGEG